jgi:hypothetical protein
VDSRLRTALIAGGAFALGIGAAVAVLGVRAGGEPLESLPDARIAESRALAATAIANVDRSPALGLLFGVEALEAPWVS